MRTTVVALIGSLIVAGAVVTAQEQAHAKPTGARAKTGAAAGVQAKIREARSAAPRDISGNATIMDWPDTPTGQMKQLRAGTNGWMCMPSTGAGGGVGADPMCLDKAFSAWAGAWMGKKDPPASSMGTAYMLRGDKGASNTDPFATGPTPNNQWVVSPAHVMVLTPDTRQLDALPTDPHNGGPWVMWKGTKYAHIMVPVATMPKSPATTAK